MNVGHDRDPRPVPAELLRNPRPAELGRWGKRLAAAGLSPGQSGNMSWRTDLGFLITRTGVALDAIGEGDWVLVTGVERTPGGEVVVRSRGLQQPSKDSAVHAAVYVARPEATTIFHFHVGFLEVLTERLGVPSTAAYFPAGTDESMQEIERFLSHHPDLDYFVLVDHGIVALGTDVDEVGRLVEDYRSRVMQETTP